MSFGKPWDRSAEDSIFQACYEACQDAYIEPRDTQAAWLGTVKEGITGGFSAFLL